MYSKIISLVNSIIQDKRDMLHCTRKRTFLFTLARWDGNCVSPSSQTAHDNFKKKQDQDTTPSPLPFDKESKRGSAQRSNTLKEVIPSA